MRGEAIGAEVGSDPRARRWAEENEGGRGGEVVEDLGGGGGRGRPPASQHLLAGHSHIMLFPGPTANFSRGRGRSSTGIALALALDLLAVRRSPPPPRLLSRHR
eukprot:6371821-Pyramimonas_sp.AAC.1